MLTPSTPTRKLFKWLARLIAVVTIGFVAYLGWFFYVFTNDPFNDWWFDEKIWKAQHNKTEHDSPRGKMVYDLQHRVLKPNLTRKQVLHILGPPDDGQDATSLRYNLGRLERYWLGPRYFCRGIW